MTDRSPRLDELASAPDGPERVALLRRLLVDSAATPAVLRQLGAVLGERWPGAALRALRGVVPHERPRVLIALAPWLDAALAREALDMIALFEAPLDIEHAFLALAPKLVDAPVVALLRVLRHIEAPPLQARLLCAVAAHAGADARAALLAAAARVAQRTASEPERLEATVAIACLDGAGAALAAWESVAQVRRRDLRVRLLATLAPAIAGERLPGLLARLAAPDHELEAILRPVLASLPGEVLLDAIAQLGPLVGPGSSVLDRLLVHALNCLRGVDLLVVAEDAMRRFDNLNARTRDELLGRAVADLEDAELVAAEPRLRRFDREIRDTLLNHAFARRRGAALVAAIERFRRCVPTLELPDAALVRAAATAPQAALDRVDALVRDAEGSMAPVIVALRRGGAVAPELLRRGLARPGQVPRQYAAAVAAALTAGRTLEHIVDAGAPADRGRITVDLFDALVALRCGAGERSAVLTRLLPRLPVERAREALLAGVRWGQSAGVVLDALLSGRASDEVADVLAALGASRTRIVLDAVDAKIPGIDPDVAFALADRLLRIDSRVVAVPRRLALLAPRFPASRLAALRRDDPSQHPARLAAFVRSLGARA